jgi:hypothetical protein
LLWVEWIRSSQVLAATNTKHKVWLRLGDKAATCIVRFPRIKHAAIIYRYFQHRCLNQDDKRVKRCIHFDDKVCTPPRRPHGDQAESGNAVRQPEMRKSPRG